MNPLLEFFSQFLIPILILIVAAVALTAFIFHRRKFDRGYRKGVPADPNEVRRENPPDEWSRSH